MAGARSEEGDFGFQIAPMVDVVFVLLLFFMACAGQTARERFLSVDLPGDLQPLVSDIEISIYIDIDPQGNVFANNIRMSNGATDRALVQLREHLAKVLEYSADDRVVIRPTPDARHERVVDVLQACRTAHVKKLSFG